MATQKHSDLIITYSYSMPPFEVGVTHCTQALTLDELQDGVVEYDAPEEWQPFANPNFPTKREAR